LSEKKKKPLLCQEKREGGGHAWHKSQGATSKRQEGDKKGVEGQRIEGEKPCSKKGSCHPRPNEVEWGIKRGEAEESRGKKTAFFAGKDLSKREEALETAEGGVSG